MNVVGIICEYNPFHKGHLYHIEQARELTQADYVVVIMSGDFVQRGEPAIMDKFTRAKTALAAGADLVLELPISYSLSSARDFGLGAVMSLNALGNINYLCFGSECNQLDQLMQIAELREDETNAFSLYLQALLKKGMSYPKAYALASSQCISQTFVPSSNDILGISYLRALKATASTIRPVLLKRAGADYKDTDIHSAFPSALSIRRALASTNDIRPIMSTLPASTVDIIQPLYEHTWPIYPNDFSSSLFLLLAQKSEEELMIIKDISPELAHRMKNQLGSFTTMSDFAMLIKHKQYTYSRIMRCFMQLLNQVTAFEEPSYLRILALKKEASCLLHTKNRKLPCIQRLSKSQDILDAHSLQSLNKDIVAHSLYRQMVYSRYGTQLEHEYVKPCLYV